jgi:hypothetical protein
LSATVKSKSSTTSQFEFEKLTIIAFPLPLVIKG